VNIKLQLGGYQGQQFRRSLAAGLVTAACGFVLILTPLGTTLERTFGLDWLFKLRGARTQPPNVAVVGISSDTAQNLGLFSREPVGWPRTEHARLINRLVSLNAQGIVFDIDFSSPKPGNEDTVLGQAIRQAGRVGLFMRTDPPKTRGSIRAVVMRLPTEALAKDARAVGPFVLAKLDQATFQYWTFKSDAGDTPAIPAAALQLKALTVYDDWLKVLKEADAPGVDHLPAHADEVKTPEDMEHLMLTFRGMFQDESLQQREREPPLQQRVLRAIDRNYGTRSDLTARHLLTALAALYAGPDDYYINFYGPPGTIRYIHYESLLKGDGKVGSDDLSNTMVFVGRANIRDPNDADSDPDFPDHVYTSFTKDGLDISGVEIMATAYANLLSGRTLTPIPKAISALTVVAFGLVTGILAYLLPATFAVPTVFAVAALYTSLLWWLWRFAEVDLWLPLSTPWLVQLPIAMLIGLMGQYLLKRRKEEQMTRAIRYYLPETLVKDLAQRQVDPTTLNRVVFGTCLASDMSDFISLGESKSPHELATFMNEYFDALAQALKRHGVDVMEFRADMIMCAWIASTRSTAICRKGMDAAIEVSEIITRFAQQYGSRHFTPRVGLQDGDVYVGHTGGGGRFLYSIVGDTANTAARLESLNKHLGTHVLAAESVVQDANGLLLRPLGLFRLRGKADPTSIFEILGRHDCAPADHIDLCSRFAEGLAAFQRREWQRAASLFEAISKSYVDDGPSRFYWAHSQKYAAEAPTFEGTAVIHMFEK
jgi:adenylate cyclase